MTSNKAFSICAAIWAGLAGWSIFLSIQFHQTLAAFIGVLFAILSIFAIILKQSSKTSN